MPSKHRFLIVFIAVFFVNSLLLAWLPQALVNRQFKRVLEASSQSSMQTALLDTWDDKLRSEAKQHIENTVTQSIQNHLQKPVDNMFIKHCTLSNAYPNNAVVSCSSNWTSIILIAVVFSAIVSQITWFLPPPIPLYIRRRLGVLERTGKIPKESFDALVREKSLSNLNDFDFERLISVMSVMPISKALKLILEDEKLIIDFPAKTITVQGVEIELSSAPFFYYSWYAYCRTINEGWYVNPRSSTPNLNDGIDIASLMSVYGGHKRAINELETQGLRAKSLDQYRSRIKEIITKHIGSSIGQKYLFEADGNSNSGMTGYRLMLDGDKIEFKDPKSALKNLGNNFP